MPDSDYWNEMWNAQMALADRKWADDHFWYQRTQLPLIGSKTSDYVDQLIPRMSLSASDAVLDIGCGDGAIAIRIAGQVRQVTALDANPNLLFPVTQRALSEGLTNLCFVNANWMEVKIGKDVEIHDVVLASRFRQISDLRFFLEQMNSAAVDRCLITWIAEREDTDEKICSALGKEYHPLPEYSVIQNLLHSMGISATVDFFKTKEIHRFRNESDAVENALRGYRVEDPNSYTSIAKNIASGLEFADGYFWKTTPARWALIWWGKE